MGAGVVDFYAECSGSDTSVTRFPIQRFYFGFCCCAAVGSFSGFQHVWDCRRSHQLGGRRVFELHGIDCGVSVWKHRQDADGVAAMLVCVCVHVYNRRQGRCVWIAQPIKCTKCLQHSNAYFTQFVVFFECVLWKQCERMHVVVSIV